MPMRFPVLIAIFLRLASVTSWSEPLPPEGVQSAEHAKFYELTGASAQELIAQMKEAGPLGKDGKRYFGKTDWTIHWRYHYEARGGSAILTRVSVTTDVTTIMPRRQAPANAGDRMAKEWVRFLAALAVHERGHAENAQRHAKHLYAVLHDHGPFASAQDLEAFVKTQGDKCITDAQTADVEYDKRTGHGNTQGATLHEPSR